MNHQLTAAVANSRIVYENAINRAIPKGLDIRDEGERAKRRRSAMRQWDRMSNPVFVTGPFFESRAMRRR